MRYVVILLALFSIGCGKREARVEWWDSYQNVLIIASPGDKIGMNQMLAAKFQETGMVVLDRSVEQGDLPHEKGLVTMVVTYSYDDGARAHFGIRLRDYTTGMQLMDNERAAENERTQFTYSEKNFGGSLEEKQKEMVDNFGRWFSKRHAAFVRDAIYTRPRWWTNEKRDTTQGR